MAFLLGAEVHRDTLLRFAALRDLLLFAKSLFVAAIVAIAAVGGSSNEQTKLFSPEF
jgi:hypothetical protein